jgi:hypothetical protein
MPNRTTTCLDCGMLTGSDIRFCPKCDNPLDQQTDGSTETIDIAHHGETVRDALQKLEAEIKLVKHGVTAYLRVVVGSGAIREAVLARLMDLEYRKVVIKHELEGGNAGAILVQLKSNS